MATNMPRRTLPENQWKFLADGRRRLGLSQAKLAEIVGVSQRTLSEWELGLSAPSHKHWDPLSSALGVPCAVVAVEVCNQWATRQSRDGATAGRSDLQARI
jgi:transcriptional regulator with XRE-family HTH domain